MAKPQFKFYIDINKDGTFAAEITNKVISANWNIGFTAAFDKVGRDNTANIIVNNNSKDFSPENTVGIYYGTLTKGRAVKITSTYSSVTQTMWLGWIDFIAPASNTNGSRQAELYCTGWMERANRRESLIPIQLNKRADEIIAVILDESDILPPSVTGRWILGEGLLNTSTTLGAITDYFSSDTGDSVFSFAGDWSTGTTVFSAITEIVQREAGRFFQKRDGKLQFYRRLHFPSDVTSLFSITDKSSDMEYDFGADVSNIIQVIYQPRTTGTVGTTLSTLAASVEIAANSITSIEYRFVNDTGTTVGATALITPVTVTDFTANTLEDGTGTDITAYITASISVTTATSATVIYTNTGVAGYILKTSKLRGTPLTKYEQQTYIAQDDDSILAFGKLSYSTDGIQDTLADAQTLGDYELSLRKDAVGKVNSITLAGWNTNLTAYILDYSVGARITMHETQTSANGDWFIMAENHSLSADDWRVQWILEDAGTITYWALGTATQSQLGDTTFLAPL